MKAPKEYHEYLEKLRAIEPPPGACVVLFTGPPDPTSTGLVAFRGLDGSNMRASALICIAESLGASVIGAVSSGGCASEVPS